MQNNVASVIVLIAATLGFAVAAYIIQKKYGKKKMVCPVGADCDTVVHSDYSRFLGIPVEIMGILYYLFVAVSYLAAMIFGSSVPPFVSLAVLAGSAGAFLFSLYLTSVQAFILRSWCSWCLISAGLCTVIFSVAFFWAGTDLGGLLAGSGQAIFIVMMLAHAVGIGATTALFVLLAKFLKDLRISGIEADVLRTQLQLVWLALGAVVLAKGAMPFAGSSFPLGAAFTIELVAVAVIVAVTAYVYIAVLPIARRIASGEDHEHEGGELHLERRIAFMAITAVLVSWYFAFVLALLRDAPLDPIVMGIVYAGCLAFAVAMSRLFERTYSQ